MTVIVNFCTLQTNAMLTMKMKCTQQNRFYTCHITLELNSNICMYLHICSIEAVKIATYFAERVTLCNNKRNVFS